MCFHIMFLYKKKSRIYRINRWCNSFIGNSSAVKKPQAKPKKMHNLGHKSYSNTAKEPQPKRVEEVYGALKCGLNEYLEMQQTELDSLTTQLKDMRRNSRLGVLYDLDKQIKTAERYIRRLEFYISKVDELYEAFCIQRRLRDGACKMKQAFEMSPLTRRARESLAEINKNYKENTENMCIIEGELENLLGEFYIKMKGLAGFARLCPGDQYEIFMRYGRQRWKLKGKIEGNGKQSWDGEEIVFQPLINELISIKVTELKGLATHLLVGSVTCETKDLFTACPQMVAVDINDLGTIKLNLEVTWYPFDTEDLTPSTGNVNKASAVQRRLSVYSQGTPETPTFEDRSFFKWLQPPPEKMRCSFIDALRDTFFDRLRRSHSFSDLPSLRLRPISGLEVYSALPDEVFENGTAAGGRRPMSFSFSDIPNGDCTPHSSNSSPSVSALSHPEITVTPPQNESEGSDQNLTSLKCQVDDSIAKSVAKETDVNLELELANDDDRSDQLASLTPCQQPLAPKTEDAFLEARIPVSYLQETDEVSELKPVELDAYEGNITKQLVKRLTSTETLVTPERVHSEGSISGESEGSRSLLEGSLEEAFHGLALCMETHKEQYEELQVLDQEVVRLESLLKCRPAVNRSRSSSLSLTVESALESFDFLNTSDFDDGHDSGDDGFGICGGADSVFSESETEKISYTSGHPQAKGLLSEALTEDTGVGTSVAGSPLPLTTGNESLDITIIKHLQHCSQLIQQLAAVGKSPILPNSLHEKLSRQRLVLENLFKIISENFGNISSVPEAVPHLKEHQNLLSFWRECAGPGNEYHTTVEKMMKQLHECYAGTLNEKSPGLAEAAFRVMVNQMLDKVDAMSSVCLPQEVLTVFDFSVYLAGQNITELHDHLIKLANEVYLLQILQSSKKEQVLQCLKELSSTDLQPLHETLKALIGLLMENNKTSEAVEVFLSGAAENRHFKEKALMYYTETLRELDVHLQKSACVALKCLNATQSVKTLVYLCQSNNEELRQVAAGTLLSLGEDGRVAYEQLNKAPQEMFISAAHRGAAVTTAF